MIVYRVVWMTRGPAVWPPDIGATARMRLGYFCERLTHTDEKTFLDALVKRGERIVRAGLKPGWRGIVRVFRMESSKQGGGVVREKVILCEEGEEETCLKSMRNHKPCCHGS